MFLSYSYTGSSSVGTYDILVGATVGLSIIASSNCCSDDRVDGSDVMPIVLSSVGDEDGTSVGCLLGTGVGKSVRCGIVGALLL